MDLLSNSVKVPMGGTRHPYTGAAASASRLNYICVDDPQGLDRILSLTYLDNYVKVIRGAVEKSGHSLKDIDFLFTNQVKRSLSHDIFQSVGLVEDHTVTSIRDFGHMGTVDTLFNLGRAMELGLIKPGCLAVMASSGAGFTWAAMALKFTQSTESNFKN